MGTHDTVIDQLNPRPTPTAHGTLDKILRLLEKLSKSEQDRVLAALRALYPTGAP